MTQLALLRRMTRRPLLGLILALVAVVLPAGSALADGDWLPGPFAAGDNTYTGYLDSPQVGATIDPTVPLDVKGWFVDGSAQGWSGFDAVHVYDGLAGSGTLLTQGMIGNARPDVATFLGNNAWTGSGVLATIPAGTLSPGAHILTIYAHTPDKGWWYKQVAITVAAPAAPATTGGSTSATVPTGILQDPVFVLTAPKYNEAVWTGDHQDYTYQMAGYAFVPNAPAGSGVQGTGITRIEIFITYKCPNATNTEQCGGSIGDATLGYASGDAASRGAQFANAGFRVDGFKPTQYPSDVTQLKARVHLVDGTVKEFNSTFRITDTKPS